MVDTVEAFLSRLHHPMLASIDLSLDRVYRLLSMLGSPHKRLPPVVHVAGTNGKGSLIACLKSILEAAGYRVHRYTSPHLVHFRERIVLAGREIDNAYLETVLRHVAPVLSAQPATFFEAATAAAFLAFSEKPADILLLETGMGGRLDATNVIDKPLLTAITPIDFDHTEHLGDTLPAIAAEKAGILKASVPCVVGRQEKEAADVIEAKAKTLSSPLYRLGAEWSWRMEDGKGFYESATRRVVFTPALEGAYQYDNAATSIACLDLLPQYKVSDEHIAQGLANVRWPARLQKLTQGSWARALPAGVELWLDGGHNMQGGRVLADWLAGHKKGEVHLICGMMRKKDAAGYLALLAPHVASLQAVSIPGENSSQSPAVIAEAARAAGIDAAVAPSPQNALQSLAGRVKNPAMICICGSLYLAGSILAANPEDMA